MGILTHGDIAGTPTGTHSSAVRNMPCGICGKEGHNRRTCPKSVDDLCASTKKMTLYHQTDKDGAAGIKRDKAIRSSEEGMLGPGKYLTECQKDTFGKANNTGYMVKCEVCVGNAMPVRGTWNNLTESTVHRRGYDSVVTRGRSRPERVIYRDDAVRVKEVYKMCAATCNNGKKCTNRAQNGCKYCGTHRK